MPDKNPIDVTEFPGKLRKVAREFAELLALPRVMLNTLHDSDCAGCNDYELNPCDCDCGMGQRQKDVRAKRDEFVKLLGLERKKIVVVESDQRSPSGAPGLRLDEEEERQ